MQLPNILKKETEEVSQFFLAIELQEDYIKTALWQVIGRLAQTVAIGPVRSFTDSESLLTATDESLATAINGCTPEPDQVVFGMPEEWIHQDKISPTYSSLIKELITKLQLKPLGFVAVSEAVLQHLKRTEGIPPSIVLVEISPSKIGVSLVKLGKVVGRELVGRSDDLGKDVEEGLARVGADQLPARILLLGDQITTEMIQQLNSYPWLDRLPFLHLPKVETPLPDFSIKAIALSGGAEAARSLGMDIDETPINQMMESATIPVKSPLEKHGFVREQDIREVENITPVLEDTFITPPQPEPPLILPPSQPVAKKPFKLPSFSFLKPKASHLPTKKPLIAAIIVLLLLIPVGAIAAYFSFAKASITLFVSPKPLEKTVSIVLTDSPSDPSEVAITKETIEVSESGSTSTTGEATVGDKATGEVTLLNKTDTPRDLKAGTVLSTDNGLAIILSDSVTVASRSAKEVNDSNGLGQLIVYGQEKAKVAAAKIGSQYNLSDGTSLLVGNFTKSSIEAKVVNGLTGGTSRTVKAVSQKDRDELLTQVTNTAKVTAQNRVSSSSTMLAAALGDVEILEQKFSHGAGEESDSLSVDVSARLNLAKFSKQSLDQSVSEGLKKEIPVGLIPSPDYTSIEIQSIISENNQLVAQVHVSTKLIPDMSQSDYVAKLAGKTVVSANEFLRNIEGYQRVTILVNPPLPLISRFLPRSASRINLDVVPQ